MTATILNLCIVVGLATIVTLIVYQASAKNPLLTIREMLGSTIHVAGILLALLGGAVINAFALGVVINKRSIHYLSPIGMGFLATGRSSGSKCPRAKS